MQKNIVFNTGKDSWEYGEKIRGFNEWHRYLGPCPSCGCRTFNYGGGWRCVDIDCFNSANNPISNLGPRPEWWEKGIQVYIDENSWCAVNADFINLQESPAGFGNTPREAVKALEQELSSVN